MIKRECDYRKNYTVKLINSINVISCNDSEGDFFSNTSQLYYARYGEKISNNVVFVKLLLGFTHITVVFGEGFGNSKLKCT